MTKIILFAISFSAANMSWAQQPTTAAPSGSTETVNADNVPIEEYVPKVIIEGKWGEGPGEFGYDGFYLEGFVPKSASFTPDDFIYPRSLAVDSKGNIYILDIANNRIQKFNVTGRYQAEFKIDSWSGYRKSPDENDGYVYDIKGINLVIDSKDTLYYYLKRIKDGKETGEVWEFKNDKLVKKLSFSKKESLPTRFELHSVGYNQWELGIVEASSSTTESHAKRVNIRKEKGDSILEVEDSSGKRISRTTIKPSEAYKKAKEKYGKANAGVYFDKMLENGNFRVRTIDGAGDIVSTEEREYTPEGKLLRRIKSPPGYSHGMEVDETGVKILRWVIEKN